MFGLAHTFDTEEPRLRAEFPRRTGALTCCRGHRRDKRGEGSGSKCSPPLTQGRPLSWICLLVRTSDGDGNGAKRTSYFLHSCEQMAGPGNNGVFLTKCPGSLETSTPNVHHTGQRGGRNAEMMEIQVGILLDY